MKSFDLGLDVYKLIFVCVTVYIRVALAQLPPSAYTDEIVTQLQQSLQSWLDQYYSYNYLKTIVTYYTTQQRYELFEAKVAFLEIDILLR